MNWNLKGDTYLKEVKPRREEIHRRQREDRRRRLAEGWVYNVAAKRERNIEEKGIYRCQWGIRVTRESGLLSELD